MTDRIEQLEAALDSLSDGFVIFDLDQRVSFWNQAATSITGFVSVQIVGRPLPESLQGLLAPVTSESAVAKAANEPSHSAVVHLRQENLQDVAVQAQTRVLRDSLGQRMGIAVSFHPTRGLDALAHGESTDSEQLKQSQSDLEERLQSAYEEFTHKNAKLGILWIMVDQGEQIKHTHGAKAFEGMLDVTERVLALGLHPDEFIGRWGESEFLILSHERNLEVLGAHAFTLVGLARTADFRWWGDRISVTVSIGAAQAGADETLANLLERAKRAMHASLHAGGNHVTPARGGDACLPS
jgi:diguanylate cyclase (GGDEF)-like protein/PAS domain S-box-containing protein